MFCQKCGKQLIEGAAFCQECGAKVVCAEEQKAEQPLQQQAHKKQLDMPEKKKSRKLPAILGVGIIVIILFVVIMNWGGTDYIGTAQSHDPLNEFPNITYKEVFDKYIDAPEWEERKEGEDHYVDANGTVRGTDNKLTVTIAVAPSSSDSDLAIISLKSVTLDGNLTFEKNDAEAFVYAMFYSYNEKESELSQLMELAELLKAEGKSEFSKTYVNEAEGISFEYPGAWTSIDLAEYSEEDDVQMAVVGLMSAEKYYDIFYSVMTVEKFWGTPEDIGGLFISDQEYESIYSNDVSVIQTEVVELDGIPARKITYVDSEDCYRQRYLYPVGTNVYRVDLGCANDYARQYEKIFDAIMDSYVITTVPSVSSDMGMDIPFGYGEDSLGEGVLTGDYTDYREWGGDYDDGWLDTTLTLSLYSDGTQDPECGFITTYFRGMQSSGMLYYLGNNEFRWEDEGYGSGMETHYVRAVKNNGEFQLELYDSAGEYEVTFTLYEQYIP